MAELTALLGKVFDGKESLSLDDVVAGIKESGAKFADLSEGNYIDKAKAKAQESRLKESIEALETERDELKKAADGGGDVATKLEQQVSELTKRLEASEKAASENAAAALKAQRAQAVNLKVADQRFARLALLDAEALVDDDTTFEDALDKVLKDNPEYTEPVKNGSRVKVTDETKGAETSTDEDLAAFASGLGLKDDD